MGRRARMVLTRFVTGHRLPLPPARPSAVSEKSLRFKRDEWDCGFSLFFTSKNSKFSRDLMNFSHGRYPRYVDSPAASVDKLPYDSCGWMPWKPEDDT